jgi:hypothetical protein
LGVHTRLRSKNIQLIFKHKEKEKMSLNLKKFNLNRIKDDHKIVMIGHSGSGKSFCLREILSHKTDIPVGTVISQTEFANRFFSAFVPGRFISDEYTPDRTEKYLKRQFQVNDASKEDDRIDPRAFLILDDCLSERVEINRDKCLKYLFFAGRHVNSFTALCMQYPLGLSPDMRGNIDFVFIFREPNAQNRRRIFETYAGMFPNYDIFTQVMDQCTQNFECMVIDNTTVSNRLDDQVFWYKANDVPAFRMCNDEYWRDNVRFRSSLAIANGDEEFDLNKARQRKGPTVHVKKTVHKF